MAKPRQVDPVLAKVRHVQAAQRRLRTDGLVARGRPRRPPRAIAANHESAAPLPPSLPPTPLTPIDEDTVGQLLQQSQAQHRTYQEAVRDTQLIAAIKALTEADRLRRLADALDPSYHAVAWRLDPDRWPHRQLLDFYQRELTAMTQALAIPHGGSH